MQEGMAARLQFASEFAQVGRDDVGLDVHQRVEAEREVDAAVGDHRQRLAVIREASHVRVRGEALLATLDAGGGDVDGDELIAKSLEELSPAAETGRDFEDRGCGDELANAREDGSRPLEFGTAPVYRPLIAVVLPAVGVAP